MNMGILIAVLFYEVVIILMVEFQGRVLQTVEVDVQDSVYVGCFVV